MRLRQFVADASHELRTPLAAIRGYAELTRRAALARRGRVLDRADLVADRADDGAGRRPAAARPAGRGAAAGRGAVDLTRLVLDGVNDAYAAGMDHRWQLDLPDEPVVVTGDASRLTQVLTNLLANARTHTPAGTTVTVGLAAATAARGSPSSTTARASPRICCRTCSSGSPAGSVVAVAARRQHRAGPGDRRRGGGRARRHGGVRSRPGRTEFAVWLPRSAVRPAARPRARERLDRRDGDATRPWLGMERTPRSLVERDPTPRSLRSGAGRPASQVTHRRDTGAAQAPPGPSAS